MSLVAIRVALETALAAITPALGTAWENTPYIPVVGTPYQRVFLLTVEPDNIEIGRMATERGFLQVSLAYPLDNGPGDALARAELIRATYYRGASFVASGTTVNIERTPEISPAMIEADRYVVPVRIRFYAHHIA